MINIYELAFSKIYGIGPKTALNVLNYVGSPENLFSLDRKELQHIFKTRERTINDIINKTMFARCEKELQFIEKFNLRAYFVTNNAYPRRLKNIPDAPLCLFIDGRGDLESKRIVSIVGSRRATDYGIWATERIVETLKQYDVVTVSGLAYGIDSASHRASLKYDIPTFAVLGHGLDMVYPREHYSLAQQLKERGGLVSEFFTQTAVSPHTFPMRNRIIAGLSDLVIVVESAKKGGSLITARLANDYNRDVMAVPGRITDKFSEGCNFLIESSRAHILSSPSSISRLMGWQKEEKDVFKPLNENPVPEVNSRESTLGKKQSLIYSVLSKRGETDIDTLSVETGISISELSAFLLELELEDFVVAKPGKVYKAI
ncbi:MAG: DNA-processing protein DprA [Bacteroidales bacterium]|nr:DNA-processing protein DprA [Bacteroidales bacterium]